MDSFARRIQSLADAAMKRALIAHEIDARPAAFVEWLDAAAASAELGDRTCKDALPWVANVLGEDAERSHALRILADARGLLSAARILAKRRRINRRGEIVEALDGEVDDPRRAHILAGREGRALTLGERRALAVLPKRKDFEKVMRDPNPMVMERLLKNPRLTEDDVLNIVVRRPQSPDILREIAKNEKWSHRVRVRLALVLNPYTPADLSMPLAPLLMKQDLELVVDTQALPLSLRALCSELLQRRRAPEPPPSDPEARTVH